MKKIISYQLLVVALFGLVLYPLWGQKAAVSGVVGGLCYAIPSIIAVLVLSLSSRSPLLSYAGFMMAEGLKIALAAVMLLLIMYFFHSQIMWLPFIIGLFLASHIVFIVFWKLNHGE